MKLIAPTVHLNGTSGDILEAQLLRVVSDLRTALGSAHDATPNARDYYVQGSDAFPAASNQHVRRVGLLQAVLKEYDELLEAVTDQNEQRKR